MLTMEDTLSRSISFTRDSRAVLLLVTIAAANLLTLASATAIKPPGYSNMQKGAAFVWFSNYYLHNYTLND